MMYNLNEMSPIIQDIEKDLALTIDDDNYVHHTYRRDEHSSARHTIRQTAYQNLWYVIEHFDKYQTEHRWLHKWTITALARYIRQHIFNGDIPQATARDIALLLVQISKMRHVL